jgi:hypothetical protein
LHYAAGWKNWLYPQNSALLKQMYFWYVFDYLLSKKWLRFDRRTTKKYQMQPKSRMCLLSIASLARRMLMAAANSGCDGKDLHLKRTLGNLQTIYLML